MDTSHGAMIALALGLAASAAGSAQAQDLNGEQVLRKVEEKGRSNDEQGLVDMVLVDEEGKQSRRSLETFFKRGEGDDDCNLVRFVEPPTVRGTALLTREATGRDDDQWVYLPAFKKSKKIASNKRTNRFAGTDFTYEDLRTEDYEANTYERLADAEVKTEDGPAAKCYVVQANPKDLALTGYSKRVIYVEQERWVVLKVEFYDQKDRHQKTLTSRGFEQVEGLWRAKRSMMEDHLRGTKTLWQFTERKINPGLADSLFTERNLERGL